MKSGTKVSFYSNGPTRTFGILISQTDVGSVIAVDAPNDTLPLVLVPSNRVAELKGSESYAEHTHRVNEEARKVAKEAATAKQKKDVKEAKAEAKSAAAAVIAALLFVFSSFSAMAIDNLSTIRTTTYSYWSGGSTNGASTLSWVIVPAHSSIERNPIAVITSIDATTDKLAAKVQSYKVLETCVSTFTNTTVSIPVNTTNTGSKWDSGTIVIRHLLTDQYEKRSLATSGGATNLEVSAATLETVVPGDIIYKVSSTGAAALTVATNGAVAATGLSFCRQTGNALLVGQPGMPLLLEIDGTGANATLNNATAIYVPGSPQSPRLTP